MAIAHELLNFAALILAGITGALLSVPARNAVRQVARGVRVQNRRR